MLISLFGFSTLYFSWPDSDLFVCDIMLYYDASHDMPLEVSDCSASVPRNILTSLDPLSTFCDLPL